MKITVPENTEPINVVTKEIFDTIQVFVIPKPEMNRTTLTLTTGRLEFCEYRFNKKTVRNITNVCTERIFDSQPFVYNKKLYGFNLD